MLRQFPLLSRVYSKLICELLPGAIVSALAGVLLNQYYTKPAAPVAAVAAPASGEIVAAIQVEQTRLIDDRAKTTELGVSETAPGPVKPDLKTARAAKPEKRVAPKPQRPSPDHQAPAGPPLQLAEMTVVTAPTATVAPPAPRSEDSGIMARLRGVTASVQDIPARIRSAMTFDDTPPRPPAPVGQDFFKASM